MESSNQTVVTYFILVGFSQNLPTCIILFIIFFLMYVLSIVGNSFLIFAVIVTPKLHTPMYYFLCNLSFLDLCCSSVPIPKLLSDLFSKTRRISLIECLIQMDVSLFLGGTECVLMAVMAYDRYIAICYPLHYTTIMSWRVCIYITVFMWSGSFLLAVGPLVAKPFVFCKENTVNHFLCEVLVLLDLACGDLSFYKIVIVGVGFFTLLSPFIFILVSYICIIISILKIRSVQGRSKAFSTCSSHLTVVLIMYGTIMVMYMGQTKSFISNLKYFSLVYTLVTPAINPLIYSLRNNEVKEAFKKILAEGSVTTT